MNMPLFPLLISTALFAISAAAHAQGKQVYTWTDENGVVHYVDTPPDNPNAVQIHAPEAYRPGSAPVTTSEEIPAEVPADGTEVAEEPSYADQKRQEMAERSAERRAKQQEMDTACTASQQQLDTLEPSRRVYFTNEKGEVERVDDEARVQRVEELKAFIAENCQQ